MSLEENKALGRRWQSDLWNGPDLPTVLARVEQLVAPDYRDHASPPGQAPDVEGLKQQLTIFYAAFPDLWTEVDDVLAEGDKVVVRWHGGGTHQGEFFGIPPSGVVGTTSGIHIFRIAEGKIVENWSNSDDLGMMQQITAAAVQPPAGQ
jgi:predicted ester cyclase